MKLEDIQVSQQEKEEVLGWLMDQQAKISKEITNTYKQYEAIQESFLTLYKKGILKGYHTASGTNIINTIKNEPE